MGTRADFYVGRGESAEWLGSIAWDGYPGGIPAAIRAAIREHVYREHVAEFLAERDDATLPEHGWPWPWDDSHLTDCVYAFDEGRVWSEFRGRWIPADEPEPEEEDEPDVRPSGIVFPNMANRKRVTLGRRSGLIVIGGK